MPKGAHLLKTIFFFSFVASAFHLIAFISHRNKILREWVQEIPVEVGEGKLLRRPLDPAAFAAAAPAAAAASRAACTALL